MSQKPEIISKLPRAAQDYIAQVELERERLQRQVAELKDRLEREMSEQPVSNFYYWPDLGKLSDKHYISATEVVCEWAGVRVTMRPVSRGVEVRFNETGSWARCAILPEVSNVIQIVPLTRNPNHESPQTPPQA